MGFEYTGLLGIVLLAANVWAIISTVQSSATTGVKVLWIVLQVAGIFISGVGIIPTLIYFLAIRPKVKAQMQ